MKSRILVTPRSLTRDGHSALEKLENEGYDVVRAAAGKQPSEDELVGLVKDCVGYLAGVEPVSATVIEAATALRVISRNGTGMDNIDLAAADRAGIRICRAVGANARGVAELTIGLLLALARSIPYTDHCLKKGLWERRMGFELQGKNLGLIGCGKIGSLVARIAIALDMTVIAYDPYPVESEEENNRPRHTGLDEVLRTSDVISLHCPSQPGKKALIDSSTLSQMKAGVYLINTARADLFNQKDVFAGLESGQIAGLAVDVFETEPPIDEMLVAHDKVIATSHIGGYTTESVDRATNEAVDNLLAALAVVS